MKTNPLNPREPMQSGFARVVAAKSRLAGTIVLRREMVAATPRRRRVNATPPSHFFRPLFGSLPRTGDEGVAATPSDAASLLRSRLLNRSGLVALRKIFIAALAVVAWSEARAVTNIFFNASQTATVVSSNINAVTICSGDYLFTHTVDGYWSAYAGGPPSGRFFSVFWPNGIQAQAITAGPSVGIGANIIIKRVDGKRFDLRAFTGKLLANTAGTGGAFEIMPLLDGEDALNDPVMFDCSGYGGQSFPHTPMLAGYDTYKMHLWVDWALTALTLIDTNPAPPRLSISLTPTNTTLLSWPTNSGDFVLQQSTDLSAASWGAVTNLVTVVGDQNQVMAPTAGARGFFRLKSP